LGTKRILPVYKILSEEAVNKISDASFDILENIGVRVPNSKVWNSLKEFGAVVDENKQVVKIPSEVTAKAIGSAGKKHILYGRDREKKVEFGYGMFNFNSTAGQYQLVDQRNVKRVDPDINDLRKAVKISDYLHNVDMVGAMVMPLDIDPDLRDIHTFFELINGTTKPFIGFILNGRSAKPIIEMMKIVCGSSENLKKFPPYEAFVEPISPLSFRPDGIDILIEFAKEDLPVCFGPMVQTGATGPINLAGTIAQENAEILSGIVITQALKPGLQVTYGGIPHVMDMQTSMISFGSPEQGLMAAAITQLAKSYGFPVYNNTGMTDSKIPDAQSGIEKAATLMLGIMSGGDIFGHLGISGADNGASFTQLIIDDEMAGYTRRIMRSFEVNADTISLDDIKEAGIGGNYFMNDKTLKDFKKEIWYPDLFDRFVWDKWEENGKKSTVDMALEAEEDIMKNHQQSFLESSMRKECEKVVESFEKESGLK
jgi:trimethylamine--corrinoid protein Co-methyltransferase